MRPNRVPAFDASTRRAIAPAEYFATGVLVVAILLGGGHLHAPVRNGLIEAASVFLLLWLLLNERRSPLPDSGRGPLALAIAGFVAILFQLVPLPWPAGLPGREMTDSALALPGIGHGWRPLSLDPSATARFAASLAVTVALALATIGAGQRGRIRLLRAIVLLSAASGVLGMLQLALGYANWTSPFGLPDPGYADGLFVNRNHQAIFLLSGLLATGLMIRLDGSGSAFGVQLGRKRVHAAWLLIPFLALMVVAAGSRAGIGFLVLVLPVAIALGYSRDRGRRRFGIPAAFVPIAVAVLLGLLIAFLLPTETMARLRTRFVWQGETRFDLFPELMLLVRSAWPWGSGFGTFVSAYGGIEDLDRLSMGYLNHAHNEYLEWAIEGGVIGVLLLAAATILFVARLWIVLGSRRSGSRKAIAATGAAILALLAAHSSVDYPLRTDAVAALVGVAIGFLFTPALDPPEPEPDPAVSGKRRRGSRKWGWLAGAIVLGLVMTAQILRLRLAEVAVNDGDAGLAALIHTHDGSASALVAEATFVRGDAAAARQQAIESIEQSPFSIVAVRTLATASDKLGDRATSRLAWRTAAGMGWRDPATQYWAMRQALADKEFAIAGQRADAILRLTEGMGPLPDLIRAELSDPAFRKALAPRLALRPFWRGSFFGDVPPDPALPGVVTTFLEMQRSAAPPTRHEVWPVMLALLRKGRWDEVLALDRPFAALRKADPGSLLDDGGFNRPAEDYTTNSTPFDWRTDLGGAPNVAKLDEAPPRAMVVMTDGRTESEALGRWVRLPPGRYQLSFRMSGTPESPSALGFSAWCGTQRLARSPTENLSGDGFQVRRFSFDVPAGCPTVMIGAGGYAAGTEADALFDDVKLERVPGVSALPARG